MNWTVDFYGMLQSNLNPLGKVQIFWEGHIFFNLPLCLELISNFLKKVEDLKKNVAFSQYLNFSHYLLTCSLTLLLEKKRKVIDAS